LPFVSPYLAVCDGGLKPRVERGLCFTNLSHQMTSFTVI
jgi:hypothetical protein